MINNIIVRLSIWSTLLLAFFWQASTVSAQEVSLEQLSLSSAYEYLEGRYPALQNEDLWRRILAEQSAKIQAESKPSLYWKTDARLQSESIQLEQPEGSTFPLEINQPLVTAQTYLEGNYLLLDGGLEDARQTALAAETAVQLQQVEVDRFQLQERVNQLFLRFSSLRSQAALFEFSLTDITSRIEQAQAAVDNGVLLPSELSKLQVREKELLAQQSSIEYQIEGTRKSLEDLLGVALNPEVELVYPTLPDALALPTIDRPEHELFRRQQTAILAQEALIDVDKRPKLNLFAQAGVGYPNPLNLLDSDPAPYALVGAGLSWKLLDWKKSEREKEILTLQALQVQNQQATFDFNLQQQEANYRAEIQRLRAQMQSDQEIIELRAIILEQSAAQLEEGVITTAEYLSQSTAELSARQQLNIHEIQLLQLQLNFWNTRGGQQ